VKVIVDHGYRGAGSRSHNDVAPPTPQPANVAGSRATSET
jgi:hypothetical protein